MSARKVAACWALALTGGLGWAFAQGKPPDAGDGQLAFNNACRTCHTLKEGDNRLGPNLYKVIGRKAGTVPGYAFSGAMTDAGIVWNRETLDRFIANPDEVVRGHRMKPFGGVASAETRARIIAYLEASGGS